MTEAYGIRQKAFHLKIQFFEIIVVAGMWGLLSQNPIVPGKCVKVRDPRLNHSGEIQLKVVTWNIC